MLQDDCCTVWSGKVKKKLFRFALVKLFIWYSGNKSTKQTKPWVQKLFRRSELDKIVDISNNTSHLSAYIVWLVFMAMHHLQWHQTWKHETQLQMNFNLTNSSEWPSDRSFCFFLFDHKIQWKPSKSKWILSIWGREWIAIILTSKRLLRWNAHQMWRNGKLIFQNLQHLFVIHSKRSRWL